MCESYLKKKPNKNKQISTHFSHFQIVERKFVVTRNLLKLCDSCNDNQVFNFIFKIFSRRKCTKPTFRQLYCKSGLVCRNFSRHGSLRGELCGASWSSPPLIRPPSPLVAQRPLINNNCRSAECRAAPWQSDGGIGRGFWIAIGRSGANPQRVLSAVLGRGLRSYVTHTETATPHTRHALY